MHILQVDHQAVFDGAQASAIMPATPNGQIQFVLAGEVYRADDIGHIGALNNNRRVSINHGVIDGSGSVIGRIAALNHRASWADLQLLYGLTC
jgi:hypothetical protein